MASVGLKIGDEYKAPSGLSYIVQPGQKTAVTSSGIVNIVPLTANQTQNTKTQNVSIPTTTKAVSWADDYKNYVQEKQIQQDFLSSLPIIDKVASSNSNLGTKTTDGKIVLPLTTISNEGKINLQTGKEVQDELTYVIKHQYDDLGFFDKLRQSLYDSQIGQNLRDKGIVGNVSDVLVGEKTTDSIFSENTKNMLIFGGLGVILIFALAKS